MPGAWLARSLVCKRKTHELVTASFAETFRHSPREWF